MWNTGWKSPFAEVHFSNLVKWERGGRWGELLFLLPLIPHAPLPSFSTFKQARWKKRDLGRKERTRNAVAIPGQNFGNIGFESEIYSYSVDIHEHCRDIVFEFLQHRSNIVAFKIVVAYIAEHHPKIYQNLVVTYLPQCGLFLLKKHFLFFCNLLYFKTFSFGSICLVAQSLNLKK